MPHSRILTGHNSVTSDPRRCHHRTYPVLALIALAMTACGGGSGTSNPSDNSNISAPEGDTSGYSGRLVWTGGTGGLQTTLRVWELSASEYVLVRNAADEGATSYFNPALSADGGTLAFTTLRPDFSQQIRLLDLASGSEAAVPKETLKPEQTRSSIRPAISSDGSTVAFVQAIWDNVPNSLPEISEISVATWSPGQAQPVALTGHDEEIQCLRMDDAATRVVYLSGDAFYSVPTAGGEVQTVALSDSSISAVKRDDYDRCPFDLSANGQTIAFIAEMADGQYALLVADTATGATTEVARDDAVEQLVSFSMSADEQRIIWKTWNANNVSSPVRLYGSTLPAAGTVATILEQGSIVGRLSPALSRDGQTIANAHFPMGMDSELRVMRFDGSDSRVVLNHSSIGVTPSLGF